MTEPIAVTIEELYMLIGERVLIIYKLESRLKMVVARLEEVRENELRLATENQALRLELQELKDGRLEQSAHNDSV